MATRYVRQLIDVGSFRVPALLGLLDSQDASVAEMTKTTKNVVRRVPTTRHSKSYKKEGRFA